MKRKPKCLLMTLGLMLALAGCGGPPSNENGAGDAGNAGNATLKIGVAIIPTTLDPGRNGYRQQGAIMQLASGTLTNQDRDGQNVSMGLAASMEPGDHQFVVKLKPGLKFSDGSPLTAHDVTASVEHYLADTTSALSSYYEPIKKVTAIDDLTVQFDLKRPYPSLPFVLASAAIIPAKSIESKGADLFKGEPLPSAGQFVVQSLGQDQITLQANPNYAGEQPSTKTVVFKKISDGGTRLAQVRGGELDYADDITPKSVGQLSPPVQAHKASAVNGSQFLGMNNRATNTLSDVRIRQAVSLAINRSQISQVAWAGQAQPMLSLFANASPNNAPFLSADADAQRAKEQLAGTKCANGCTLRLIVRSDSEPQNDVAVVVQQNLKAIGIQVNIEKSDTATVGQFQKDGNYDLVVTGTYGSDPGSYLLYVLGPAIHAMRSEYSSPEMDRLLQQVSQSSGAELAAAVGRVNDLFAKDMPIAPIAEYSITSVSRVPSERFTTDPGGFLFHVG